ncbi:MAG: class I SAM-dependent methyltransferase [Cephaloticoccus sp.]|nr:class I SAM-dependent methyltransferase [Cephaloticoccus sp.]MCF7759966.1 class I SAM-dependent methyltransferase [Cephaloticoccus sp.]
MSRDVTHRFSDRVTHYVRYRPGYPSGLITALQDAAALPPHSTLADIGSGTGILTALLLPATDQIFAIEPNAAMRAAAERDLGHCPGFHSIDATAEATTLLDASVDLITAGQAFHWFEPTTTRIEFARILKPGGHVALIWNERLTDTTPFLSAYEHLLKSRATDYDQVNHTRIDAAVIKDFFAPVSFETFEFPNAQHFDLAGLVGRALSSSYVPNAGQPGHEEFFAELENIYHEHATDDRVTFVYQTRLYLGQL